MHRQVLDGIATVRRSLYLRAGRRQEELAVCAHRLHGGAPSEEQWADFLDFFAIEWVDGSGRTEVEHAVAAGELPEAALRWPREVRTALWVVVGWEGDLVLLRDIATEDEIAVHAPGVQADLTRRTVVRARVVPWGEHLVFSGEPDVFGELGVMARMELLQGWRETAEPGLIEELRELRAGYLRQREERAAFVAFFGADEVIFPDAAAMEEALPRFVHFLINEHAVPSLGGRTRAAAHRESKGSEPSIVQFRLGETLTGPGRPGAIYDEVEGIHFLPRLGELYDHLRGVADAPDVVRLYLDDPGITALPFRRAGRTEALARLLGVDDAPLDTLLAPYKELHARRLPSVLPGLDD